MKIAFLICVIPRTFVYKKQIECFTKLKSQFPTSDFFILLRLPEFTNIINKIDRSPRNPKQYPPNPGIEHQIQTEQGLKNLQKQIDNIKPIL